MGINPSESPKVCAACGSTLVCKWIPEAGDLWPSDGCPKCDVDQLFKISQELAELKALLLVDPSYYRHSIREVAKCYAVAPTPEGYTGVILRGLPEAFAAFEAEVTRKALSRE